MVDKNEYEQLKKEDILYFDDKENKHCQSYDVNPHILVLGRVGRGKKFRSNSIRAVHQEN